VSEVLGVLGRRLGGMMGMRPSPKEKWWIQHGIAMVLIGNVMV